MTASTSITGFERETGHRGAPDVLNLHHDPGQDIEDKHAKPLEDEGPLRVVVTTKTGTGNA